MPVTDPRLSNPIGGLWWHARAWRSQDAWQNVMRSMHDEWLSSSPSAERLVLIGPSAGWMLSTDWLTRFKELETWDSDPWAGRLFDWRHGQALRQAGIGVRHCVGDPWSHEADWFRIERRSLYWFDHVLGQLHVAQPQEQARQQLDRLKARLGRVVWGSVHARYSGPLRGDGPEPDPWRSKSGVDVKDPQAHEWLQAWGAQGEWLDHLTPKVFRRHSPVLNLAWPYKPEYGHWLEMGWQLP